MKKIFLLTFLTLALSTAFADDDCKDCPVVWPPKYPPPVDPDPPALTQARPQSPEPQLLDVATGKRPVWKLAL